MDEQETLPQLCEKYGIRVAAKQRMPNAAEVATGQHDAGRTFWNVVLIRNVPHAVREIATEYSMGPAHKGLPKAADVLYSLIMDATGARDRTFAEWCSDLGVDSDSRRAHASWCTCVETDVRIKRFLGAELESFELAAQEY